MASMPFTSLMSCLPMRCERQPATMIFLTLPVFFCLTASLMAAIASALAGAMKPQVFITTMSALSVSGVISMPAWAIWASIFSLSTMFFGQPSAMKPTVMVFVFFTIGVQVSRKKAAGHDF